MSTAAVQLRCALCILFVDVCVLLQLTLCDVRSLIGLVMCWMCVVSEVYFTSV